MNRRFVSVLVAAVLAVSACSGPPVGERTAAIDFLWVSKPQGEYKGGLSHAVIHVTPSDDPGLQVGIFETKAAGTGPSWRATIWQAVLLGSLYVGIFPTEHRYWVETESLSEKVDGPSAGALFTVAVVAALRGDAMRPEATITGTINPDGSIGPVDGVVQKFDAAIKAGKKRLGYPAGMRYTMDLSTGKAVDLELFAQERGAQAEEVADLQAAYTLMAGRRLPLRSPLDPEDMVLGEETRNLLLRKAETWRAMAQELYGDREGGAAGLPSGQDKTLWGEANQAWQRSEEMARKGLAAVAYSEAVQAYTYASVVSALEPFGAAMGKGEWQAAFAHVADMVGAADEGLKGMMDRMAGLELRSYGDAVQALDAYEAVLHAFASLQVAAGQQSGLLERLGKEAGDKKNLAEELVREATGRLTEICIAQVYLRVAKDYIALLDLERDDHGRAVRPAALEEVQGIFEAAAEANLEYFDTLYVGTIADRANLNPDTVRKELLEKERTYRTAFLNLKLPKTLFSNLAPEGTLSHNLARLSGALSSFFASSSLITRYVVLEVRKENGEVKGLRREQALETMLVLAERAARVHAAVALDRIGAVPVSARIEYELGRWRQGRKELSERLDALSHFWRASKWCQIAIALEMWDRRDREKGTP
ncbi:MAG: S16 family serine protease [Pseudomonadota bacterium]